MGPLDQGLHAYHANSRLMRSSMALCYYVHVQAHLLAAMRRSGQCSPLHASMRTRRLLLIPLHAHTLRRSSWQSAGTPAPART